MMQDMNLTPKLLSIISANNTFNKFVTNKIFHLTISGNFVRSSFKLKSKYYSQKASDAHNYQIAKYQNDM
jgi:hypothetical protein